MGDEGAQSQDMIMRMMSRNNTSEKLLEQIDDAVKKVSDEAYATALKQISDNREAMERSWRSCARRRPCRATSSAPPWPSTRLAATTATCIPASSEGRLSTARPVKIGNTIIGTRAPSGRCGAARI